MGRIMNRVFYEGDILTDEDREQLEAVGVEPQTVEDFIGQGAIVEVCAKTFGTSITVVLPSTMKPLQFVENAIQFVQQSYVYENEYCINDVSVSKNQFGEIVLTGEIS
jgi:hypothetical protein